MTFEELVLKHNELLAYVEVEEEHHAACMKPYNEAIRAILATLQQMLQEGKLQNVKTEYGTPYLHTSNSVKVDNRDMFLKFIVDKGMWNLLDARALKKPVEEFIDQHDGARPPGIIAEPFVSCRIRDKKTNGDAQS